MFIYYTGSYTFSISFLRSAHSPPPPPPPPSQNQYNNGSGAGGYPSNQKASGAGYEYDYRGAGNQEAYYGDQAGGDGLPPKKEVVGITKIKYYIPQPIYTYNYIAPLYKSLFTMLRFKDDRHF